MANINRPIRLRRCAYTNRGCTATVRQDALLSHYEECSFAPVQCSHEGCQVTVNRQDVINHQQNCEFRSVTCEECDEAVKQKDYVRHSCVLQRKLAEVTRILQEIQGGEQSPANQPYATRAQPDNDLVHLTTSQTQQAAEILQFETTQVEQVVTRRFSSQVVEQPKSAPRPLPRRRVNHLQLAAPSTSDAEYFIAACSVSRRRQRQPPVEGEIIVAGGSYSGRKSYEIFNWSTQQWTLYADELFFDHTDGFSFFYDNKVMFCGGRRTNRVECLDIANYRTVCTFPSQLPGTNCGKGVLCGDRILTFGQSVSATSLLNPFGTKVLVDYGDIQKISNRGIARVNDDAVIVVGGSKESLKSVRWQDRRSQGSRVDDVSLYNPSTNVMKTLAPLPYELCDTTVVAHGDNIIILGGDQKGREMTNKVLMYNIAKQQCSKLPSMLEKRSNCAAVIIEDTVVVFGGEIKNARRRSVTDSDSDSGSDYDYDHDNDDKGKTAEYLVLGENSWKRLPPMHYERCGATACVLP